MTVTQPELWALIAATALALYGAWNLLDLLTVRWRRAWRYHAEQKRWQRHEAAFRRALQEEADRLDPQPGQVIVASITDAARWRRAR